MPTLREWVIEVVAMVAVGIALAALGPFGSFAMGTFPARLAYWIPAALVGYAIFRPITLGAVMTAGRLDLPELPAAAVGVLVAAVPGTLAIAYLSGHRSVSERDFDHLFQLYVQVGLIGVMVMMLFTLLDPGALRRPPSLREVRATPLAALATPRGPEAEIAFLGRLPPRLRGQFTALEMEDHYVRAHANGTSALILLRMSDAERELVGLDGMRVHRSWWVARTAVERVLRDGRNYRLRLTGGLEAPVARDRVGALRSAGWLG
ncbi:MAG: LytTR family DNA-binding domain-containing protein [Sphingomicrobium sp.]